MGSALVTAERSSAASASGTEDTATSAMQVSERMANFALEIGTDIVVGSSAQQLIMLAVQVVATLFGNTKLTIAVEDPGYPTIFDSFERLGHQLVGIEIDAYGAIPGSLENALTLGDVSVWVALSPQVGSSEVIDQGAALGVLVAPGEPFFVGIGHHDVIRINAGSANDADQAAEVGDKLATAILRAADSSSRSFLDSHV
jgi:DNA-binding transcriptional MocR family regulator